MKVNGSEGKKTEVAGRAVKCKTCPFIAQDNAAFLQEKGKDLVVSKKQRFPSLCRLDLYSP